MTKGCASPHYTTSAGPSETTPEGEGPLDARLRAAQLSGCGSIVEGID
jgi:hypothetical protein